MGSGNIVLTANPSGVAGAIQFSNGSAFASDASNLFWDDTNKRLGVGTNAPTEIVEIVRNAAVNNRVLISNSNTTTSTARATLEVKVGGSLTGLFSAIQGSGIFVGSNSNDRLLLTTGGSPQVNVQSNGNTNFGNSVNDLGAKVGIKGSGSTSATTSLLVQNSGGTALLTITDDGNSIFNSSITSTPIVSRTSSSTSVIELQNAGSTRRFRILASSTLTTFEASNTDGITTNSSLNVGGSTSSNASAILQADSTTKGFLPPRMTTTQKNAITAATGLVLYDTTTNKLCCYNGSTWNDLF